MQTTKLNGIRGGAFYVLISKIVLSLAVCVIAALSATATTYYVKPGGDDSKNGKTLENAFATPKKGFSVVNSKGNVNDTVIIEPGTYILDDAIGCTGANQGYRVTVRGSTDNPADVVLKAGGTFELLRLAQNITVANLTIANGSNDGRTQLAAGVRVGAVNADPDTLGLCIVSNCVITGCHNAYTNGAASYGGPVYIHNNGLLVDSVVSNNTAVYRGCGITMNGAKAKALRCRIEGNSATRSGDSGISVFGIAKDCGQLVDCVVQSNVTAYCAGARDIAYVEGCTFRGNILEPAKGNHSSTAMSINYPTVVTNCTFVENQAVKGFGTVYATEWDVKFLDCRFLGNVVSNYAAAINFITGSSPACRAKIENCVFADNSAQKDDSQLPTGGGAIRLAVGYVDVIGCTFTNNMARFGGAIDVVTNGNGKVSCLSCTNCLFVDNTAWDCGGGVRVANSAQALFDDCKFIDNKAIRDMGTTSVTADEGGGGVFIYQVKEGGFFSASNCVFSGNSGMRGGGVGSTWDYSITPYGTIHNCVFTNNASLRQGGGLSIRVKVKETNRSQDDLFAIRNSLFAFNRTIGKADNGTSIGDSNGGGILLVDYAPVTIENCTIVSNVTAYTSSGGLHMPWNGRIVNCIVAYNLKSDGTAQETINWSAANGATFSNCCTYPSTATVLATSPGYINVDPKFVDPAQGDFRLAADSPCVNAGVNADWMSGKGSKDLAGNPRIYKGTVDIGCYELWMPPGLMIFLR